MKDKDKEEIKEKNKDEETIKKKQKNKDKIYDKEKTYTNDGSNITNQGE